MSEMKIELWGFLGKDPELRKSEKPNVTFPIAINVKGQNRPIWYEIHSYMDLEEIQFYLKKGMSCHVIGTFFEEQVGKRKIKKVIIKDNDTDIIGFKRDVPRLRNNY